MDAVHSVVVSGLRLQSRIRIRSARPRVRETGMTNPLASSEQENTEPVAPSSTIPTSFPPGLAASAYDPQEWLRPRSAPYSVHSQPMRRSYLAQPVLTGKPRKERNKRASF